MVNRSTPQNKQEYKDKRKDTHEIFRQKKRVLFISKLGQIACNNNETNKFYQEVNSIRKGLKLQTLL
jgi:hypothetical protein